MLVLYVGSDLRGTCCIKLVLYVNTAELLEIQCYFELYFVVLYSMFTFSVVLRRIVDYSMFTFSVVLRSIV
jgi:hypothetical protein